MFFLIPACSNAIGGIYVVVNGGFLCGLAPVAGVISHWKTEDIPRGKLDYLRISWGLTLLAGHY